MFNSEEIKCLKRRIEELEKNRFHVSEFPIGEYLSREENYFQLGGEPILKWIPFSLKHIVETCPEGSIKIRLWHDCSFWLTKDEFFYYNSAYISIKEKIEAKMKEKSKK